MKRLFVVAVVAAVLPIASAGAFTRGDLFVADHGSVLELTSTGGLVQTYTDPSVAFLIDIAFDNARTALYATDSIRHDVKVFDTSGALSFSFGAANLALPRGIAVAPNGDVWVADTGANK